MKSPMKTMTLTMALAMGSLFGLSACDQSKAELDSTKQELATAKAENGNLKSQVDAMKAQLDQAKKDADDAKAKLAEAQAQQAAATAQAAPSTEPMGKEKGKDHSAAHHPGGKMPGAAQAMPAPKDPTAKPGTVNNPIVAPSKGAGAF